MKVHFFKSPDLLEKYPQEPAEVYYSLQPGYYVIILRGRYLHEIRAGDDQPAGLLTGLLIAIWQNHYWESRGGHWADLTIEE